MSSDSLHSPWSTIPYPASIDLHHYLWRSDKNVKIWKIHRLSHYINSPSEIDKSTFPLHLAPSVWWYLNPFMTDFEKSFVQVCKNSVIFAIKSIYFLFVVKDCWQQQLHNMLTRYWLRILHKSYYLPDKVASFPWSWDCTCSVLQSRVYNVLSQVFTIHILFAPTKKVWYKDLNGHYIQVWFQNYWRRLYLNRRL